MSLGIADIFDKLFCRPHLISAFAPEMESDFLQRLADLIPLMCQCFRFDDICADPIACHILELAEQIEPRYEAVKLWDAQLPTIVVQGEANNEEYNFTSRCDEILKLGYQAYQEKVNPQTRKSAGQWFTPTPVISYMVRSTVLIYEEQFGSFADIPGRILEPSCGIGSFVVAMLPFFGDRIEERYKDGTIVACEIDPVAAFLTRLNVTNTFSQSFDPIPFNNVMCINTLENREL